MEQMNLSKFEIDGIGYVVDNMGVVRQDPLVISQKYDTEYVHDRYDIKPEKVHAMSMLRAGYIIGTLGYVPKKVLDIGYGNGDFLSVMRDYGSECYGHDISGYPLPDGCQAVDWAGVLSGIWSVVCMFDSFEHMPRVDFIGALRTSVIVITVPWFHGELGADWFASWKHRRSGEHVRAFSPDALLNLMESHDYTCIRRMSIEDGIRGKLNGIENTFTAIYIKR